MTGNNRTDLEVLLESFPHGVQEIDCRGTITYANGAHHRIYGYEEGELVGKSIFGLSPTGEDATELRAYLASLVEEQPDPTPWTGRDRRRDGTAVDVRVDWNYLRSAAGEVRGFISVITDLSAQKKTEKSLVESEERFRNVVESAPMGIHFYRGEPDGRLVFTGANAAADRFLGVDNSQFVGKTIEEAFPPLGETEIPERYRRACFHGEPWQAEQVLYEDEKFSGAFEVNAFQTSPGRMAAIFTEITERKRAEEDLRESEEKFRSIYENAMDGILVADAESKIFIDANSRICRMLGYTRGELLRLSVADIHPVKDLPGIMAQFESQLRGEMAVAESLPVLRRDGTVFPVDIAASLATLGGRKCLIGIFRDVTERVAAEKERAALRASVRQSQKMEALGTLAGGIAHDFNNILGAILGYAELAQLKTGREDPVYQDMTALLDAVDKARQLVRQVLAFSRPREENMRPLDMTEEVTKALAIVRASAPGTVRIGERIEPGEYVIMADPAQIQQVLINLCTNALQAMEGGGEMEVGLERADSAPQDLPPGEAAAGFVKITVRDSGPGMTAEVRERIFDPFFTTKEPGKGTGMGLSIAHRVIAVHDGRVTVASEPGRGALFTVLLPLTATAREGTAAEEKSPPRGTEHILYVEDEQSVAHVGRKILESLGYRVTVARRGAEALERFCANPSDYDVVVTDQAMPEMTGADLAVAILAVRPDIPIILCTGFSSHVTAKDARALGIREFILKPLGRKKFADVVRRALDS